MKKIKLNFFYIHGINTSNPNFHKLWKKRISDIIGEYKKDTKPESSIDEEKLYIKINHIPIKWESVSWIHDLQLIGLSKYFRDQVVTEIISHLENKKENNNSHNMFISHSFGSVWIYKAISRIIESNHEMIPHWNVMVGGALGGTNLPFGGIYIKMLREKHQIYNKPKEINRWFNLINPDDYVSTWIHSINGLENKIIEYGSFNPGLSEHDAMYYLNSDEFEHIVTQFLSDSINKSV